ncbi:MAG: acetyltransferase [Gracilimonas sp.]|uniref:GNAT family N-acetyltransferase n=1 Tax=Gracilimonas sp. TaxID=1974203 RepID=UPI003750A2D4|nr:acetyltransferase [Gracilimonas sp.]
MSYITLRTPTPGDLSLLQHWEKQPHVIAAVPNDYWAWEAELQNPAAWREQLIAELDDRPVGFLQIIDPALEETHYWGEIEENYRAIDIWIGEAEDLGKGYGTEMMRKAIDRCFVDPKVYTIWIDPLESNKDAIRFYKRLGFEFVERRRFGQDECAVYRLERINWKK